VIRQLWPAISLKPDLESYFVRRRHLLVTTQRRPSAVTSNKEMFERVALMNGDRGRSYWASRPDSSRLDYFWSELKAGRLRQGWGYHPSQDLRLFLKKEWKDRSPEEAETYRHRHMLGGDDGWQPGDVVLVPNLPERGMFSLAEVTGPYDFQISDHEDYGHVRVVRLLTPNGVANSSHLVTAAIRSTLRTVSRTWNISVLEEDIKSLIAEAGNEEILQKSSEIQRTERVFRQTLSSAIAALQADFGKQLKTRLRAAEWEKVILAAARVRFPGAQVRHTGGPSERGADFEIELLNPFGGAPWIIVVQVKDYQGEIGAEVASQLRDAIQTRNEKKEDGLIGRHVIAAILASTAAKPSAELTAECRKIEDDLKVPVTVIYGDELMELILRGVMQHGLMSEELIDAT
jgi:predicted Mrr-cat superfamily restriction endonuclease